jgi:hypothetical protein
VELRGGRSSRDAEERRRDGGPGLSGGLRLGTTTRGGGALRRGVAIHGERWRRSSVGAGPRRLLLCPLRRPHLYLHYRPRLLQAPNQGQIRHTDLQTRRPVLRRLVLLSAASSEHRREVRGGWAQRCSVHTRSALGIGWVGGNGTVALPSQYAGAGFLDAKGALQGV